MKIILQLTAFTCLLLGSLTLQAQTVKVIEPSADIANPTDIFPIIMGDTTASGDRTDANTIYQLQNGNVYVLSDRIDGDFHIQIESTDPMDLTNKPIISRLPNASGDRQKIIYSRGDLTLKNLWIISGENGPLEQHHWGQIRLFGENSTVRVSDCIIEKDRGGFLQLRANGVKCYVDGCILRNGGNRRILQGNGRGIDARNFQFDSLVVRNTVIHNVIDRVFRSQGGITPHNYIEFDHCTVFNQTGRHGTFQFGRVNTEKITNNLLVNPNMLGTAPRYTDEQTQPDNSAHKVFTVDTLYAETNFSFAANNIFWTQDVLDYYASNDTVSQVEIYSDLILENIGEAEGTYFADPVSLNNVPTSLLQYVMDLYANPASEEMFDFVVEDALVAGTPFDSGNLFDFSSFDPCYPSTAMSATGDTGGGAVGAVSFCDDLAPGEGTNTIVDVIVNSPDHTLLEQAVIAADLAGTLAGDGPFTVFAPTDDAFGMLDDGVLEGLLADPEAALTSILTYHVVGAAVQSADLSNGQMVTTLNGKDVTVTIDNDMVFINDAQVTVADIAADNGVVHVIDAILIPPADPVDSVRYVDIAPSDDIANPKDIFPIIMGDTTDMGERVFTNTIYRLQNGHVYVLSDRLDSQGGWPLQVEAIDLEDTDNKPIISRLPNASGDRQKIAYARGDMMLRNLWIIGGENGPLEQHHWGQIRLFGENSRVVVTDCLLEKDRGGFLQLRANGVKLYVDNCVLRNGGNRRILQGNGRGIDARNFQFDSLVVTNTIIHNIIDRVFRSQGGITPHNYIEFDHNTVFNQTGRHGTFQFGRVNTVKVTNNLLINPNMMGTAPRYTDEQTQPDNDAHKVFTVDTLYDGTNFTFAANNIFWTQDVLDYYASNDTVSQVDIYSDLILQTIGDPEGTYFQEEVTLANVPVSLLQYVMDLYANPASEEMFDFVVEDILVAGTPFDSGNLFDFSAFDPCYDDTSVSATAGTDGTAIGAVLACSMLMSVDVFEHETNSTLALSVYPNPMEQHATISYNLTRPGEVRLSIHDLLGRVVNVLVDEQQISGEKHIAVPSVYALPRGVYLARLQTEEGSMTVKFSKR